MYLRKEEKKKHIWQHFSTKSYIFLGRPIHYTKVFFFFLICEYASFLKNAAFANPLYLNLQFMLQCCFNYDFCTSTLNIFICIFTFILLFFPHQSKSFSQFQEPFFSFGIGEPYLWFVSKYVVVQTLQKCDCTHVRSYGNTGFGESDTRLSDIFEESEQHRLYVR